MVVPALVDWPCGIHSSAEIDTQVKNSILSGWFTVKKLLNVIAIVLLSARVRRHLKPKTWQYSYSIKYNRKACGWNTDLSVCNNRICFLHQHGISFQISSDFEDTFIYQSVHSSAVELSVWFYRGQIGQPSLHVSASPYWLMLTDYICLVPSDDYLVLPSSCPHLL